MAVERMSDGKLHKLLKQRLRETWERIRRRIGDIHAATMEMGRRIENSPRIQNLIYLLESRGRFDLTACAYNGVKFA